MGNKIIKITRYLLDFMFFIGILVTVGVSFVIRYYGRYYSYFAEHVIGISIVFTVSGVLALFLLSELRKIMKSVELDNCFIRENVTSLSKIGNYSFLIVIVTSFRLVIYITPAVLVVILTFLIAGLFSKVLSQVFDSAVTYKIENDLTI